MLASQISEETLSRDLSALASGMLAEAGVPGAAVALMLDGRPIFSAGIGSRDLAGRDAMRADAQFLIYSITKTLIAATVVGLAERGALDLDQPVQRYLPALPLDRPVTLRQILNHTGGLPGYPAVYAADLRADPTRPWTTDDYLRLGLAQGLLFDPGAGWAYSNIGFMLLRLVLEELAGPTLGAALERQIFAPLDLTATFVANDLADLRDLAPGYGAMGGAAEADIRPLYHPGWVSHGVAVSTAPELARAIDGLFAGALIGPAGLAQMLEPVPVPARHPLFSQPAYGLGLMLDPGSPYGLMAGHGGGGPGYSAGALHLPDVAGRRITSAALVNHERGDLGLPLAHALASRLALMINDQ